MLKKITLGLLLILVFTALLSAQETRSVPILFNPSSFRPLFTLELEQGFSTRDLPAGTALAINAPVRFSGLGVKKYPLDKLTYFAEWNGRKGLFLLGEKQVLVYNAVPMIIKLSFRDLSPLPGDGRLIRGNFALTDVKNGTVVELSDEKGNTEVFPVQGGKAYLILQSQGRINLSALN